VNMTANQPSTIDEEAFAVRRTIRIAASIERVWAAVTEPEHISRWFARTELDGSDAGSHGTMTFDRESPIPLRIEAIDEPRMVAYRWNNDDALGTTPEEFDEATSTVFTFTLVAVPDGTELTVVETGFGATSDPGRNMRSHSEGWTLELDKLVALLEGDR
jgi:uncharacterized protein YndB with AHSA1/START domain